MKTMELIRGRRSVRNFDGHPVSDEIKQEILDFAAAAKNPYGQDITWRILDAKKDALSSPVITGTDTYIAGKMMRAPHAEEAFGYSFECIVLHAAEKGLGTTIIAGTMDRGAFERAMDLEAGEILPCVSPLGVPAEKMSMREKLMRTGIRADSRLPFEELFFEGNFDTPLTMEKADSLARNLGGVSAKGMTDTSPEALTATKAGHLADVLEMVRWAPSAVNKQPWRLVICGDTVHFYEKRSKGYVDADGWDIQKIDMGIAMCHFALGCEEAGMDTAFEISDPGLDAPEGSIYIASCRLSAKEDSHE